MYALFGTDDNPYRAMVCVLNAMKEQGFSDQEQVAYMREATGGSREEFLAVSQKMIQECNRREAEGK
jgi:hypothetical protein